MVVPFLSESSVDFVFLQAVKESSSDWLDSFNESRKSVNCGICVNFLIILRLNNKYFRGIVEDSCLGFGGWVLFVEWEKYEIINILEKSLFISIKRFLRFIVSPVINRDTNRSSKIDTQSSSLNFLESESTTRPLTMVIFDSGTVDKWSQFIEWSGSNRSSSGSSCLKSSLLSGSLIEPYSNVSLPMFS